MGTFEASRMPLVELKFRLAIGQQPGLAKLRVRIKDIIIVYELCRKRNEWRKAKRPG